MWDQLDTKARTALNGLATFIVGILIACTVVIFGQPALFIGGFVSSVGSLMLINCLFMRSG